MPKDTTISIDDVTPDSANVRLRTERSSEVIRNSLKQFGAGRSIVMDADGVVRAGNGTVEQAKAVGITKVRVIETDGKELIAVKRTDLTGPEATAYAIADNRSSDLSTWAFDDLDAQLGALNEAEFDLEALGFNEEELAGLFEAATDGEDGAGPGENPYTGKTDVPTYEVTGDKPTISETYNDTKARDLISKIEASDIPDDEKHLLLAAAYRHVVFNYRNLANYYVHSLPEVQQLFEDSALVIVDVEDAIQNGWASLSSALSDIYAEGHPDDS